MANRKIDNDTAKIDEFVRKRGEIAKAAIETCCGAACLADELQNRYRWNIRQAHAGYVNRMKQSSDKTDLADAGLLADLVRVGYLPEVWLPHEPIRHLRSYVRRREQLSKHRTAEKLRIRALLRNSRLSPSGKAWTKEWKDWILHADEVPSDLRDLFEDHFDMIAILTKKMEKVERKLRALTADDPLVEQLLKQKGIGVVTVWVMRAEIANFTRFGSGQPLDPLVVSSAIARRNR